MVDWRLSKTYLPRPIAGVTARLRWGPVGAVALRRKDFATANLAFTRVLAMSPDETSTLFFAAETQEGLAHPADAAKLYARFAEVADKLPSEKARVLLARDRMTRLAPGSK